MPLPEFDDLPFNALPDMSPYSPGHTGRPHLIRSRINRIEVS